MYISLIRAMRSQIKIFVIFITVVLYAGCERGDDSVSPQEDLPPSTPANFALYDARDGEVAIVWDENNDFNLEGYEIFRSIGDTLSFQKIGIVPPETYYNDNYYIDDSLDYDITYFYKIRALKYSGLKSGFTQIVSATPVNARPPTISMYLNADGRNWEGQKEIYLNWEPSVYTDIAYYNIYRSTQSDFTPDSSNKIGFAKNAFYSDTSGIKELKTYYYVYEAVDKGGLVSKSYSYTASAIVHTSPEVIAPINGGIIGEFSFKLKSIKAPAIYEVVLLSNPYYGEIWRGQVNDSGTTDTVTINLDYYSLYPDRYYYWRIITYSTEDSPNSISNVYSFWISR